MINVSSRVNISEQYNTSCILSIITLVTDAEYQNQGIGQTLVSASLDMGRQLYAGEDVKTPLDAESASNITANPGVLSAIMTFNYSQAIAHKLGFDELYEADYSQFEYDGKTFLERLENRTSAILFAKSLQCEN